MSVSDEVRSEHSGPDRRELFKRLAITCAAAAYMSPRVMAYSPPGQLSPGAPVFNVQLPASYNAVGSVQTFAITPPGGAPLPVQFLTNVSATLTAGGANIADITGGASGMSVDPNPLLAIGINAGRLSGVLGGSPPAVGNFGRLNLFTGVYTPPSAPVPFDMTSESNGTVPTTGWQFSGGGVAPQTAAGNYDCDVDIDADVAIPVAAAAGGGHMDAVVQNMVFDPAP
jgi:hypothetical protein